MIKLDLNYFKTNKIMIPAIVLILFCIFGQLVILTLIQLKDLKIVPQLEVLLLTTILFVLALWQTYNVWEAGSDINRQLGY